MFSVLATIVIFNLVLFLFNLLPLAPLDGYRIAVGVLPPEQSQSMVRYERETTLILMLLLMLGLISNGRVNLLWTVLGPPLRFLYRAILGF
jgi:Zn-dependent protease